MKELFIHQKSIGVEYLEALRTTHVALSIQIRGYILQCKRRFKKMKNVIYIKR